MLNIGSRSPHPLQNSRIWSFVAVVVVTVVAAAVVVVNLLCLSKVERGRPLFFRRKCRTAFAMLVAAL